MKRVVVHVDESCLGNQFQDRATPGAAGGIVEIEEGDQWVRKDFWISEPDTTNNRMALRSAIETMAAFSERQAIELTSDSQYLVKGMNEWIHGWKRRGWTRKAGPIENLELWKELDREAAKQTVTWLWVRGHAGHPKNEYANFLATRAAEQQDTSGGLIESGLFDWLAAEQARGRYLDFDAEPK